MNLPLSNKGVPDWVKFGLTIAITLASVVGSYTALTERVAALTDKHEALVREVDALDGRLTINDASFTEIKVQLAEIQRDILYIKQTLDKHDGG
jgi:peptidoglycan hydrolase CwlO-like protein